MMNYKLQPSAAKCITLGTFAFALTYIVYYVVGMTIESQRSFFCIFMLIVSGMITFPRIKSVFLSTMGKKWFVYLRRAIHASFIPLSISYWVYFNKCYHAGILTDQMYFVLFASIGFCIFTVIWAIAHG